jgi:hypothetical protein
MFSLRTDPISPRPTRAKRLVNEAHNPGCRRRFFTYLHFFPVDAQMNRSPDLKIIPLIAVLSLLGSAEAATAQILNGSFESPAISNLSVLGLGVAPGVQIYTSISDPTGITDWTVESGDVTLVNGSAALTSSLGLLTAASGNQYVLLNGIAETVTVVPLGIGISQTGTIGDISQTFSTTAGRSYQISFEYRGLAVGLLTNNPTIDVGLTNASSSTAPGNGTLSATIALGAWQTDTFTFVATGSNSTLSFFQDSSGANIGLIGLDNVVLTALPEPSQYGAAAVAFLIVLMGGRIWSRRRQSVALGA